MKYQQTHMMKAIYILGLLLLPLSSFAAGGLTNFFNPPPTDISLQVMQNIFGTGTDSLNGKLIRPLLMVFSSGIVIFMGGIFAWNLTKFVLHTAQEGEMMVGKGKQMGLVVLRSVIGISMVIPAYSSAAFKGLSLSFILVAWLITQGIGLADRGVNAIVDYLAAGGTIYQVAQNSKDTASKQDMVKPALDVLAAETCVYTLRQAAKDAEARQLKIDATLKAAGSPVPARRAPQASDVGFYFNAAQGKAQFGTKNRDPANKTQPYGNECGTVTWPTDANDQQRNFALSTAMLQMIMDLDPLAANISRSYPVVCAAGTTCSPNYAALNTQMLSIVANSILNYSNLIAPLRTRNADAATKAAYNTLQSIKYKGWIVLGAYYPMMGNLNQNNKQSLTAFSPTTTPGNLKNISAGMAVGGSDSLYDFSKLQDVNKDAVKQQFAYVASQQPEIKAFIGYLEAANGGTLQEQLKYDTAGMGGEAGPFQGGWAKIQDTASGAVNTITGAADTKDQSGQNVKDSAGNIIGADVSGADRIQAIKNIANAAGSYTAYGITQGPATLSKFFGLGGESSTTGETLGGVLEHGKLTKSATAVGLASAVGGPMAWVTIPPMLVVFVAIVDRFRNTLDQTQNADPLLALQDFGFFVMDQAMILLAVIIGGSFAASLIAAIPSVSLTGLLASNASMLSPIIAIFFSALAMAGIGFGVYIPMIPFIVWISAILGWIGHSFQAIIGAPLVALRMTTAEGEGMLGGATEGVMMLLGVLLTPFLLVVGFSATLILIKQVMIVVNYLFSLFAYFSFDPRKDSFSWIVIGVPAILMVYFTLITTVIQSLSTKLIGEFPGEVLRHLHTAMTGHKAAEQMMGKMEQSSEKFGGGAGELSGKGSSQDRQAFKGNLPGAGGGGGKKS